MNIKELNLREPEVVTSPITLNSGVNLDVREYLPIDDKADLITWVITMAVDDKTGCISPIRFETCFSIAVVQRYAGVEIDPEMTISEVYDLLETNDVISQVMGAIPKEELDFLSSLAEDTAKDIVRYNNSFAGMISVLSSDTNSLNDQITDILDKIKNGEGLEQLAVIKDMVGND